MDKKKMFDDLCSNISQIINNSPVKDIEKNVRSLMTQAFSKLDLVTREEFDLQASAISQLREQVAQLQARLDKIETAEASSSNQAG